LEQSKLLELSEDNKKYYGAREDVVLQLNVKNVKEFTVEVYEIDTERHHLNNSGDIDDGVSLDCIKPIATKAVAVDIGNPFKHNKVELPLKGLIESRPSIYIVDLKGEGLASRAVIRRGAITAVKRETLAGLDISFFWDDGKPITELEVWRNGQKLQVKDKLVIPYGQSASNIKIVALKDGFA